MTTAGAQTTRYGPRLPPQYGPGFRPALSPYLNLLRGGDISSNYYLGVNPEFQRRDDRTLLITRERELTNITHDLTNVTSDLRAQKEVVIRGTPSVFDTTNKTFDNTDGAFPPTVTPRQRTSR